MSVRQRRDQRMTGDSAPPIQRTGAERHALLERLERLRTPQEPQVEWLDRGTEGQRGIESTQTPLPRRRDSQHTNPPPTRTYPTYTLPRPAISEAERHEIVERERASPPQLSGGVEWLPPATTGNSSGSLETRLQEQQGEIEELQRQYARGIQDRATPDRELPPAVIRRVPSPETSASQTAPQSNTPEVHSQSAGNYQRQLHELESRLEDLHRSIQQGTTDGTGDPELERTRSRTDPTYRPPMPERSSGDALHRGLPRTDIPLPLTLSEVRDSEDRSTGEHRGTESEQVGFSEERVREPIIYDPELRMYGTAAEVEARYREIEADIHYRREERERHFQALRRRSPSEFRRIREQLTVDEQRAASSYIRLQGLLADTSLVERERRDLTYRTDFLIRRTFTPRVHELIIWWEILEYGPEEAERRSRARAIAIYMEQRYGAVDIDFAAHARQRLAGLEAARSGIFGAIGAGVGSIVQDLQGGRFDPEDHTADRLAQLGSILDSLLEGVAPIAEGISRHAELRRIPERELNSLPTLPPEPPTLVIPQQSARSSGTPEQRGIRERLGGESSRRTPERAARRHTASDSARTRTRSRHREASRSRSREEHGRLPEIQNPQEIPLQIGTEPRPQVQQLRGVRYGDLPPRILTGDTARTGGISRVAAGELIDEGRAVFVVVEGRVFPRLEHGFGRLMEFNRDSRLRRPSSLTVEGTSLADYEYSHLWGPRWGDEARDGIMLAPRQLNQVFQNHGVETTIDRIAALANALGGTVHVVARARSFPRDRMRSLRGREFLLREVEYEVSVDIPGITNGRENVFRASIEVDHPSTGGQVHNPEVTRMGAYYSLFSH
ncbi:hypothetical protein H6F93_01725 [Leptolyngbya sp. FACHB-671]|uniref:polymorphic toxin type 4 domain-containing protein n=1 Tax=Leptolyngbya sp. FACHB-671 TaxID=2692812 RepID=UPI0016841AFA|nr:polymorphic toxin type 4 domain-containing protein [Leptolyngbya sp. FACHB-671]MBD2066258.1 hypothetical protein [Leptolyngbya sp. FACHB-671]